ncbi:MAG: D-aminoacylase [Gemmataceae bacterium]|nr:D-aminoacylase [Gemmataceae bacterium]
MLALTLAACSLIPAAVGDAAVEADVVLQGATLYDGAGGPGKPGDVAIKDDRIVAVGTFQTKGKPRVLDCSGLIITPGFIDLHTHSDYPLQKKPTNMNRNYLAQGVTTVVTGNCGAGPVDVAGYFRKLEELGQGANVIHQVPHNDVRKKAMGNVNREPTAEELKKMEDLVDQGMRDGAWGLATGLIYNPGTYAKTEELIALAKVAAKHGGFYASHMRNEADTIFEALEEILAIARKAGIRVHISHIKVTGRRNWGKAPDVIAFIRRARQEGLKVTADQYPYPASSTSLMAMAIPAKWREGDNKDLLARLDDPELGPKIRHEIERLIVDRDYGKSLKIASFKSRPEWQGKPLGMIAAAEKLSVLDLVLHIQKEGGAQIVSYGMSEEDVRLFMKEPYVATASDGSSQVPAKTVPHPRSYGCFPRKVGRYALEDKVIPLEHALRSCNGLPADILQLRDRGYLKPGYYADLVVFDPKTMRDKATFDVPHVYAKGVEHLLVNGKFAIERGVFTDTLAGRVLRHSENKRQSGNAK